MLTVFGEDVLRISGFSLFLTLHAVAVHVTRVYILRSHIFCPRSFLTSDHNLTRCYFHSDPRLAQEYSTWSAKLKLALIFLEAFLHFITATPLRSRNLP